MSLTFFLNHLSVNYESIVSNQIDALKNCKNPGTVGSKVRGVVKNSLISNINPVHMDFVIVNYFWYFDRFFMGLT